MHASSRSSRSGIKTIHSSGTYAQTLALTTITALAKLVVDHQITGVNLWSEYDEEIDATTFHCEAGGRQFQSSDVAFCILKAAGMMPTKTCSGPCQRSLSIDCFPRQRMSPDGRSLKCNTCNRAQVKLSYRKRHA